MSDALVDLSSPKRVHVIGVGGAGMSAITEVLSGMGHTVTGSDLKDSAGIERLRALGVTCHIGHEEQNLGSAELVTRSNAVPDRNPECQSAVRRGIPLVPRADILAAICNERRTIAVAGTHGKTTTASMFALILRRAEERPSFVIGGDVNEIGSGAAWDEGRFLVVEADESDRTFTKLPRQAGIITNVEPDHLDFYGEYSALLNEFERFVRETDGPVMVGIDESDGSRVAAATKAERVGTDDAAEWRLCDIQETWGGVSFVLREPEENQLQIDLAVPGLHNARNAACAAALARRLEIPSEAITDALASFGGVSRRFEHRGKFSGVEFVDDYAHLPTEIRATIAAASVRNWQRIVAVFQPHRFSRIERFATEFGSCFAGADKIYVTDIYAAGEIPKPGISGRLVVDAIRNSVPDSDVNYFPRRDELIESLVGELREGDLCLSMGAGDLTMVSDAVRKRLSEQ